MSNPTLSDPLIDWSNSTNNWRAEDAEWLQARSVVRYSTDTSTATGHAEAGSVAYFADSGGSPAAPYWSGVVTNSGSPVWKKFLNSNNVKITDGSGTVTFRQSSAASGVILTSAGEVSIEGTLNVGSWLSGNSTDGLVLKATGYTSGKIKNVAGTTVLSDIDVQVSENLSVDGDAEIAGTATVTGALSGYSAAFSNNVTVAGTLDVTGATTGTTSVFSTSVQSPIIRTGNSGAGVVQLTGITLVNALSTTTRVSVGNGTIFLQGATRQLKDAAGNTANIAGWVQSTDAPVSTSYPEGTLWLQTTP